MRETPSAISKALREYDARLSLRWNNVTGVWMFYCEEESLFAYRHEDDSFAIEPSVGEVMQIIRRADGRNSRDFWTREMRRARQRRLDKAAREEEAIKERCSDEAQDRTDFFRKGPTPMVSPLLPSAT